MAHASATPASDTLRHHLRSLSASTKSKKPQSHTTPARSTRPGGPRRDPSKSQLPRLGAPPERAKSRSRDQEHDHDHDMAAATFLQFCTTCEQQISVPSTSVLYCSEACRKRDSHKSSEYPLFQTDLSPPPSPQRSFDLDHQHPVDVVPQRSPTSFPSPITSRRTSTVHASSDDDLDSDVRDQSRNTSSASLASSVFASRPSMGRHDSEAGSYLQQYYSTSRPIVARNPSHTPSLSHTPTSTSGTSVPFTPVSTGASSTRQAPFRSWSRPGSMHFSSKSVDLVTPITIEQQKSVDVPSSMSTTVASDDTIRMDLEQLSLHPDPESTGRSVSGESLPYPKSSTVGTLQSPASSSLKALFQFEQMRSAPSRG